MADTAEIKKNPLDDLTWDINELLKIEADGEPKSGPDKYHETLVRLAYLSVYVAKDKTRASEYVRKIKSHTLSPAMKSFIEGLSFKEGLEGKDSPTILFSESTYPLTVYERGMYFINKTLGVEGEEKRGLSLIKEAVAQNCAPAQNFLGTCLLHGSHGCTQDVGAAKKLFEQAAASGFALAQLNLANCYHRGIGIDKDDEQVFAWVVKALQQGAFPTEEMQTLIRELADDQKTALPKAVKFAKMVNYLTPQQNFNFGSIIYQNLASTERSSDFDEKFRLMEKYFSAAITKGLYNEVDKFLDDHQHDTNRFNW